MLQGLYSLYNSQKDTIDSLESQKRRNKEAYEKEVFDLKQSIQQYKLINSQAKEENAALAKKNQSLQRELDQKEARIKDLLAEAQSQSQLAMRESRKRYSFLTINYIGRKSLTKQSSSIMVLSFAARNRKRH